MPVASPGSRSTLGLFLPSCNCPGFWFNRGDARSAERHVVNLVTLDSQRCQGYEVADRLGDGSRQPRVVVERPATFHFAESVPLPAPNATQLTVWTWVTRRKTHAGFRLPGRCSRRRGTGARGATPGRPGLCRPACYAPASCACSHHACCSAVTAVDVATWVANRAMAPRVHAQTLQHQQVAEYSRDGACELVRKQIPGRPASAARHEAGGDHGWGNSQNVWEPRPRLHVAG